MDVFNKINVLNNILNYTEGEVFDINELKLSDSFVDNKKLVIPFSNDFVASELKERVILFNKLRTVFPGVFIVKKEKTTYKSTLINKIIIKTTGVNYKVSKDNTFILNNYLFYSLSLYIRLALHLVDSDVIDRTKEYNSLEELFMDCKIEKISPSTTNDWITSYIGSDYSEGQLVDFIDKIYDEYKHILKQPNIFQFLFRSFGRHIENVCNSAFDYYMECREIDVSWTNAVADYLVEHCRFNIDYAVSLASVLTVRQ